MKIKELEDYLELSVREMTGDVKSYLEIAFVENKLLSSFDLIDAVEDDMIVCQIMATIDCWGDEELITIGYNSDSFVVVGSE